MPRLFIVMTICILSLSACASFSEKGRMEKMQDTAKAFEFALLRSDYRSAAGFIDPSVLPAQIDFDQYKKIKIVDCRPNRIDVSADKLSVKRNVELQYFLVDRNILRSTSYQEQWIYSEEKEVWMMNSGLPVFDD